MDPTNTTLFVGGLDPNVTDVVLMTTFAVFGTIVYCRVPPVSQPPPLYPSLLS